MKMFKFPEDPVRRKTWCNALQRKNWNPTKNSWICYTHFLTGKPSYDPQHPDYVPSIFKFSKMCIEDGQKKLERYKRRRKEIRRMFMKTYLESSSSDDGHLYSETEDSSSDDEHVRSLMMFGDHGRLLLDHFCDFCGEYIFDTDYDEHVEQCDSRTEICQWCCEPIKVKNKEGHLTMCEVRVTCIHCEQRFRASKFDNHKCVPKDDCRNRSRKNKYLRASFWIARIRKRYRMLQNKKSSIPITKQVQDTSATGFKESFNENSKEKPRSSKTSNCKGCDCGLSHSALLSVNNTLRDLNGLLQKQEGCDVIIKVKGQEFRAHKAILMARSPVLASTFRYEMKEKATGVVDIEDCDPSSFPNFLSFLYCGTVENLTTENVFSLFTTADKYNVQDLRSECLEFIKKNLSIDTFYETITLALFEKELIDWTAKFFAKHLKEIIVTVKWQRFVVENPIHSTEIMIKAFVPNEK